jgi:hypothetical protein
MRRALIVLTFAFVFAADVCIDSKTELASVQENCAAGSTAFRAASANIFNLLWSVWTPTQWPHPAHIGNWSTSYRALEDMKQANLTYFRVFGTPWAAKDILLWKTSTASYWKNMTTMVTKVGELGLKMHVSITPTLSQFAIAANCTTRELITNKTGHGRTMLKAYVRDMVGRFKDDTTVLTWGMGNELNLAADGCSYGGIPGQPSKADSFFTTAEMMSFSRDYVSWIRDVDPTRPIGSDMGKPRTRAMHLATTQGGGEKCVNVYNPHGDCEVNCSVVPKDSEQDYKQYLRLVSEPFDLVSGLRV